MVRAFVNVVRAFMGAHGFDQRRNKTEYSIFLNNLSIYLFVYFKITIAFDLRIRL